MQSRLNFVIYEPVQIANTFFRIILRSFCMYCNEFRSSINGVRNFYVRLPKKFFEPFSDYSVIYCVIFENIFYGCLR